MTTASAAALVSLLRIFCNKSRPLVPRERLQSITKASMFVDEADTASSMVRLGVTWNPSSSKSILIRSVFVLSSSNTMMFAISFLYFGWVLLLEFCSLWLVCDLPTGLKLDMVLRVLLIPTLLQCHIVIVFLSGRNVIYFCLIKLAGWIGRIFYRIVFNPGWLCWQGVDYGRFGK